MSCTTLEKVGYTLDLLPLQLVSVFCQQNLQWNTLQTSLFQAASKPGRAIIFITFSGKVSIGRLLKIPGIQLQFFCVPHNIAVTLAVILWSGHSSVLQTRFITSFFQQLYNPNVEAPVSKVLQHLKECFQYNSTKGQFDVQYNNDKLRLQLSSHLTGGVPFKWRFEGSKSSEEVCETVKIFWQNYLVMKNWSYITCSNWPY